MVTRIIDTGLSSAAYPTPEPPAILEVRIACEKALSDVGRAFINESVQATTLGFKELDAKQFVTLEDLETLIDQEIQKVS